MLHKLISCISRAPLNAFAQQMESIPLDTEPEIFKKTIEQLLTNYDFSLRQYVNRQYMKKKVIILQKLSTEYIQSLLHLLTEKDHQTSQLLVITDKNRLGCDHVDMLNKLTVRFESQTLCEKLSACIQRVVTGKPSNVDRNYHYLNELIKSKLEKNTSSSQSILKNLSVDFQVMENEGTQFCDQKIKDHALPTGLKDLLVSAAPTLGSKHDPVNKQIESISRIYFQNQFLNLKVNNIKSIIHSQKGVVLVSISDQLLAEITNKDTRVSQLRSDLAVDFLRKVSAYT